MPFLYNVPAWGIGARMTRAHRYVTLEKRHGGNTLVSLCGRRDLSGMYEVKPFPDGPHTCKVCLKKSLG